MVIQETTSKIGQAHEILFRTKKTEPDLDLPKEFNAYTHVTLTVWPCRVGDTDLFLRLYVSKASRNQSKMKKTKKKLKKI